MPDNNLEFNEEEIYAIERPNPALLIQYFCWAVAGVILFPIIFIPLLFKYMTLKYRFDDQGISMSWGVLFRREINLTYARIQDIHVSRGIIERWLGIATLSVQTASGNATAEMSIQGLKEYDPLRDFLYSKMRGHRFGRKKNVAGADAAEAAQSDEALELLKQIHADLAAIRQALPEKPQPEGGADHV
ncbi:MAG: PH domain-containing protein [Candidatus Sumerlaeia bacterium]